MGAHSRERLPLQRGLGGVARRNPAADRRTGSRIGSGQLLSRTTTDLQLLHEFLARALPFLVVNAVTLAVGCVIKSFGRGREQARPEQVLAQLHHC